MKQESQALLEALQSDTREIILATTYLQQVDPTILSQSPKAAGWSAAQVIAHLNSYGRYYLPAIEKAMEPIEGGNEKYFKAGWLGDYFTRSMLPGKNGRILNKMQSPKDHRPASDIDSKLQIEEFLSQQQLLLELLEQAKQKSISRIRVPISLSRFVRLKLGDTFRFLIAHHQRHFVQIKNIVQEVREQQKLKPVFT